MAGNVLRLGAGGAFTTKLTTKHKCSNLRKTVIRSTEPPLAPNRCYRLPFCLSWLGVCRELSGKSGLSCRVVRSGYFYFLKGKRKKLKFLVGRKRGRLFCKFWFAGWLLRDLQMCLTLCGCCLCRYGCKNCQAECKLYELVCKKYQSGRKLCQSGC